MRRYTEIRREVQGCQILEHAPALRGRVYSLKKFNKIEGIMTSSDWRRGLTNQDYNHHPSRRDASSADRTDEPFE